MIIINEFLSPSKHNLVYVVICLGNMMSDNLLQLIINLRNMAQKGREIVKMNVDELSHVEMLVRR